MKSKQKRKGFFSSIKSLFQRKKTSEAPAHDAGSIAVTKGRYKGNPDLLLMGYNTLALTAGNKTDRIEAIRTYEQMLLDDKISQVFQIVNSSVRSLSWSIEAENTDVARFIKDCLLKLDFKNFVGNLLTARAFGFALFEEIWSTDSSPNSMQFYTIKSEKLLPYDKVDFVMDDYANLVGIEVNGESRPLHWFHRFTYPEVKPESYFYGVSDLTKIHREWYTKDVLKKYRNIGLENFAFPIVLVTFDQYKYRRGSQEWDKLWELVNGIKNDARLMVPGSRNISEMAGILPDVDIKFLEPSFGGSGFNAFETAIESENKAIARNLGMPDNLGYSDVGSGSYAKSQTEYDLYWRNVVDIAEAVQDSVQEVVDRLLRYNYPTERARFVFDLSRDKGITQEKVAILQGMIAAGVKPTKEYVAGFLDLGESDFDLNLDTVVINPASVGGNEAIEGFSKKKDKKAKKKIKAYKYQLSPDADLKEGSEHYPFCEAHDGEIIAADDPRLKFITPPNHHNCKSKLVPVMVFPEDVDWGEGTYSDVEKYPMAGFGREGLIGLEGKQKIAEEKVEQDKKQDDFFKKINSVKRLSIKQIEKYIADGVLDESLLKRLTSGKVNEMVNWMFWEAYNFDDDFRLKSKDPRKEKWDNIKRAMKTGNINKLNKSIKEAKEDHSKREKAKAKWRRRIKLSMASGMTSSSPLLEHSLDENPADYIFAETPKRKAKNTVYFKPGSTRYEDLVGKIRRSREYKATLSKIKKKVQAGRNRGTFRLEFNRHGLELEAGDLFLALHGTSEQEYSYNRARNILTIEFADVWDFEKIEPIGLNLTKRSIARLNNEAADDNDDFIIQDFRIEIVIEEKDFLDKKSN